MPNYSLNFSRASNAVLLQYYNFLRLGHEGYERIVANLMENAGELEKALTASGRFELLNDARYLPVVVVRPTDVGGDVDVFDLSERLRERGWIVPAYPLPPERRVGLGAAHGGQGELQPRHGRDAGDRHRGGAGEDRRRAVAAGQGGWRPAAHLLSWPVGPNPAPVPSHGPYC